MDNFEWIILIAVAFFYAGYCWGKREKQGGE